MRRIICQRICDCECTKKTCMSVCVCVCMSLRLFSLSEQGVTVRNCNLSLVTRLFEMKQTRKRLTRAHLHLHTRWPDRLRFGVAVCALC